MSALADRIVAAPRRGPIAIARRRLADLIRDPGFAAARQIARAAPIRDLLLGIADHSPYLWSLAIEDPRGLRVCCCDLPRTRSMR